MRAVSGSAVKWTDVGVTLDCEVLFIKHSNEEVTIFQNDVYPSSNESDLDTTWNVSLSTLLLDYISCRAFANRMSVSLSVHCCRSFDRRCITYFMYHRGHT